MKYPPIPSTRCMSLSPTLISALYGPLFEGHSDGTSQWTVPASTDEMCAKAGTVRCRQAVDMRAVRPVRIRCSLDLACELVREGGKAGTDSPGVEEAHGLLLASLAEEALAGPEHDRIDNQPQLVEEIVLD